MPEPLTRDQVREMLWEIVAEYPPDHVYESVEFGGRRGCVYVVDGQPSCLIGILLHRLGITVPERLNFEPFSTLAMRDFLYGWFDADAVEYLIAVQRYQDSQVSWRECLEIADKTMRTIRVSHTLTRSDDTDPNATV